MLKLIRVWLLAILGMGAAAFQALAGNNSGAAFSRWPDTGQTKCYNETVEIPCPAVGAAFHGQDAQYAGPARSYTVLAGGMVQDNVTGLVWDKKSNSDDWSDYTNPHDADNKYSWCDPDPNTNGGFEGNCLAAHNTKTFLDQLNSTNFGGYNDWRLPTIKELITLVDYSRSFPAEDPVFFDIIGGYDYINWSSTTDVDHASSARGVSFSSGEQKVIDKLEATGWIGYGYVHAVRGGQNPPIANRYVDNGNTITDTVTGLEWQKALMDIDNDGYPDVMMNWQAALAAAENLTLAGKSDWRLPDLNELHSLVDYSRSHPTIDPVFADPIFVAMAQWGASCWSSTTVALDYSRWGLYTNYSNQAWLIDFDRGYEYLNAKDLNNSFVRAVRGGQPGALGYWILSPSYARLDVPQQFVLTGSNGSNQFTLSSTVTVNNCTPDPDFTPVITPTSVTIRCTPKLVGRQAVVINGNPNVGITVTVAGNFPWTMFLPAITHKVQ